MLEQLVQDSLQSKGFATMHTGRFNPCETGSDYLKKHDSVASDIYVVGLHPLLRGKEHVCVVSCKSWQGGFDPKKRIELIEKNKRIAGRPAWKSFRELVKKKWADGLIAEIRRRTGSGEFTYITAVTLLKGGAS